MNILIIRRAGTHAITHLNEGEVFETSIAHLEDRTYRDQLRQFDFAAVLLKDVVWTELADAPRQFLVEALEGRSQVVRTIWSKIAQDGAS